MNILKKTMTTLCLSLIFLVSLNGNYAIAKVKEIAQNNTKEQNEIKEVKNYSIVNIVSKNGGKLAYYKHKKTGFSVVVSFPPKDADFYDIAGGLFIRHFEEDGKGVAHVLDHLLGIPLLNMFNKKGYEYFFRNISAGDLSETPSLDGGIGFVLNANCWKKEIVDAYFNEIKDPTFLKDGGKMLESQKKRMNIELRGKDFYAGVSREHRKNLTDRFFNGKFPTSGFVSEIEKVDISYLKKQYGKIMVPSNMLMTISFQKNQDYKEIMERVDEKYLSCYSGPFENNIPKDFKKLVDKTPYRKFEMLESDMKAYNKGETADDKKFKKHGRVYWDVGNLTPAEKDLFRLQYKVYEKYLKKEIEKMGYSKVRVLGALDVMYVFDFEPLRRNNLFYLDFYGNDSAAFKKETLIKNAKELNAKFYEKMKSIKSEDFVKEFFNLPNWAYQSLFCSYRNTSLRNVLWDSFSFTGDPLSAEFFDMENGEIKDDFEGKRFEENVKKNVDKFKVLFEKDPDFIDIFTTKSKAKKSGEKSAELRQIKNPCETYKNPILIDENISNLQKIKNKSVDDFVKIHKLNMVEQYLKDYKIGRKLDEEGLAYDVQCFPAMEIPKENVAAVEKYIFEDLIKKIKNGETKPSFKEFEELKNAVILNLNYEIDDFSKKREKIAKILKDHNEIKKLAVSTQKSKRLGIAFQELMIDEFRKRLLKAKGDKEKEKQIKKQLKESEKMLEDLKSGKFDLKYYYKAVEENLKRDLAGMKEDELNRMKRVLENVKKMTYEEFLDEFKKIKIEPGFKLKKYDFEKERAKYKKS